MKLKVRMFPLSIGKTVISISIMVIMFFVLNEILGDSKHKTLVLYLYSFFQAPALMWWSGIEPFTNRDEIHVPYWMFSKEERDILEGKDDDT
jgi:hypothetical protein